MSQKSGRLSTGGPAADSPKMLSISNSRATCRWRFPPDCSSSSRNGCFARPMEAEFDLVVQCCRWTFAGDNAQAVEALAVSPDWPLIVRLARRHRVEALVWTALETMGIPVPADAAEALAADTR